MDQFLGGPDWLSEMQYIYLIDRARGSVWGNIGRVLFLRVYGAHGDTAAKRVRMRNLLI